MVTGLDPRPSPTERPSVQACHMMRNAPRDGMPRDTVKDTKKCRSKLREDNETAERCMKYIGTDVRVIEQKLQKPTQGSPLGGAISHPSPHQQRHATPRVVRWPTHARPRDAGPRLPRTGLSHRPPRLAATPVSASAQHPSSSVATRWLLGDKLGLQYTSNQQCHSARRA